MSSSLRAPVALFLFNRPRPTARVFEAIRAARPAHLFVVADGPRADHPGEAERCRAAREVLRGVDWPCAVATDFSEANLGLKRRIETGLDWVFAHTEEAIVLEDDCEPHASFFPFCDALLARYRDDERVMSIAGSNWHFGRCRPPGSYHFSRYPLMWGWATWRRAWRWYDPDTARWPALRESGWLEERLETPAAVRHWSDVFTRNHESPHTWDYAWTLACWLRDGLCATPNVNLVSNLGFGAESTHTRDPGSRFARMPVGEMIFPLTHPDRIERDREADLVAEDVAHSGEWFLRPMFAAIRAAVATGGRRRGLAATEPHATMRAGGTDASAGAHD